MIHLPSNINSIWSDLLIEELVRCGVTCFAVSSGARSGTLASAVARHPAVTPVMHFDERASAFFALGHARATGRPSVWITTSGTALANGWPAVVEAAQDGVPLILLTADRPPELRDTGANQTIDQVRFFEPYVRWQVDMPCPDTSIAPSYVLTTVDQAVARAMQPSAGPVHLNAMFRDPLTPAPDGKDYNAYLEALADWMTGSQPYTRIAPYRRKADADAVSQLQSAMSEAGNGVIVVGRLNSDGDRAAIKEWLSTIPWPVMADITSGLRPGGGVDNLIHYADHVLLGPQADLRPDFICHLGGPVVSKRVLQWIESSDAPYAVVKAHTRRQDPSHRARWVIESDLVDFTEVWRAAPAAIKPASSLDAWRAASEWVARELSSFVGADRETDEIFVAHEVSRLRPGSHGLFLASSMPIRDMDMYSSVHGASGPVAANRGASGIDGTIATAAGWSRGSCSPVIVVLGDLSFLHDLNALQYVRQSEEPIILVVINNNGGGIFSFLPIAEHTDVFETCFGTPHGLTFAHAAAQFELPYVQASTRKDFSDQLSQALAARRSCLMEVLTDRDGNVRVHREFQDRIRRLMRGA